MPSIYGTWRSPVTPRMLADGGRFDDVGWDTSPLDVSAIDEDSSAADTLVWIERRGAGNIIVAQTISDNGYDAPRDLTTDADRAGGRVGYGGGTFTVHNGTVYFAGASGRLYRVPLSGGQSKPITPAFGAAASPVVSPDGNWIVFVHTYEDVDGLALVDVNGEQFPRKLAYGSDFVMQPAWHPSGNQLAYVAWDHPNMPWDSTTLWLAEIVCDTQNVPMIASKTPLVSGSSVLQPTFSPDGRYLAYVGESKGWWQIFLYDLLTGTHKVITSAEAEHATPAWIQGQRTFTWLSDESLVFIRNAAGFSSLWRYDLKTRKEHQLLEVEAYTHLAQIAVSRRKPSRIAMIAASPTTPQRVISLTLDPDATMTNRTDTETFVIRATTTATVHRRSMPENIPVARLSIPQPVAWTSEENETIYGLYYPPAPEGDELPAGLPPLMVLVHGGPTSQTVATYSAQTQFFATRGYAVLWVNHRGSTGYGRAYRDKLRGTWGVYDVEDAASGVNYLAENGLIDPQKAVIMGGSAGGYTVLQSLVTKPGFYRAGVSLYGVSDQFALVAETHKFESRYNDSIMGTLPEAAAIYRERSPIFHADKIRDPLILFHGTDDNNVPPNQSEMIVAALKRRGVPHEFHLFAGEGHGFRKPENIETMYKAIEAFLTKYVIYQG